MERQTHTEGALPFDPKRVKQIKLALIALAVVGVGVLAFFIIRAVQADKASQRWDELASIQARYEPNDPRQDPLFEGPGDTYRDRRSRYVKELEALLERAGDDDTALSAQVHWLIAKLSADQVLAMKDTVDPAQRRVHWDRAKQHLEILRDRYPNFQTNWLTFAPTGHGSLTRAFLTTVEANISWEAQHLPAAREPSESPVVLVRTTRGDMRIGLYREEAPELTHLFLEHALRGDYDGTAFFAKDDEREGGVSEMVTLRGGHPASRDAAAFSFETHQAFTGAEDADAVLPEPARWSIPIDRGVVVAWHEKASEYDGPQQILIALQRSPRLDHRYTPIGKLLDVASHDTADRIFGGAVWGDDPDVDAEGDVTTFLQAPVKIVKVLVYENGALETPADVAPTKAAATETEGTLAGVQKDAYLADAPQRPAPPPSPEEGDEGDADGEKPAEGTEVPPGDE